MIQRKSVAQLPAWKHEWRRSNGRHIALEVWGVTKRDVHQIGNRSSDLKKNMICTWEIWSDIYAQRRLERTSKIIQNYPLVWDNRPDAREVKEPLIKSQFVERRMLAHISGLSIFETSNLEPTYKLRQKGMPLSRLYKHQCSRSRCSIESGQSSCTWPALW